MKFIKEELFPLAKFLVVNQTRKFGTTIKNVIIAKEPNTTIAGYYDPDKKDICLNIDALDIPETILRYNLCRKEKETKQEYIIRTGAAILFEECYHAAHHGTELNTEELATAYGKKQAEHLPTAILTKYGEKFMTTYAKTKDLQEKVIIPLTGGGMFNFINEISKKKEMNTVIPTRYGSMEIINNEHITTIKHTTNVKMLDEVKKTLGHITRVGIEYAGMIYVHEDNVWKTFVDVDSERMAETEINRPTETYLTKIEGHDPTIELRR